MYTWFLIAEVTVVTVSIYSWLSSFCKRRNKKKHDKEKQSSNE